MRPWILIALTACAGEPETAAVSIDEPSTAEAVVAEAPRGDDIPWDVAVVDADEDGVATEDGDCDDLDPDVHPFVPLDTCDGVDSDCDGELDEDYAGGFVVDNVSLDLGELADEEAIIVGYAFPDGDEDAFRFEVDDGYGWFSVEAWLYGTPEDVDLSLELVWLEDANGAYRGVVATADDDGAGGFETLDHGGETFTDDSGLYEVRVRAESGSSCSSPYTLQIQTGGL